MVRRLMSRRGGSASQPQVDDGWREWENTKQELVLVKRQLTEKDELVLQLKTASRRLQETLRKKEKDLQAAFAILRSPQDAKTTKTRKQELMDRLVAECTQRAVNAEALAEERRQELNRLKYSSKFLRFQELEVEIEECHHEIKRLRAKLETAAPVSPTIIGKMKISSASSPIGSPTKTIKPVSSSVVNDLNPEGKLIASAPTKLSPNRTLPSLSAHGIGKVRVIPLGKYDQREGFVSKTRRRALEAEHYKQVRLAQLEVECELEENLHIRAAREAKRIQFAEQSERQAALNEEAARALQAALALATERDEPSIAESANDTNKLHPTADKDDSNQNSTAERLDSVQVVTEHKENNNMVNAHENEGVSPRTETSNAQNYDTGNSDHEEAAPESHDQTGAMENHQVHQSPEMPQSMGEKAISSLDDDQVDGHTDEARESQEMQNVVEGGKQQQYEDDEFDGSAGGVISDSETAKPDDINRSVWNLDPIPGTNHLNDNEEEDITNSNDAEHSERAAIWNVDLDPLAPTVEKIFDDEVDRREAWNLDPHSEVLEASLGNDKKITSTDDLSAVVPASNAPKDENIEGSVWNLDPNASSTSDGSAVVGSSHSEVAEHAAFVEEDDTQIDNAQDDQISDKNIWNVDPNPSSALQPLVSNNSEAVAPHETSESVAWNVDPYPGPISPANDEEDTPNDVEEKVIWNLDPNPLSELIPRSSAAVVAVEENVGEDNKRAMWNVDPNPPALDNIQNSHDDPSPQSLPNDPQLINSPLYIRTFGEEGEDLGFHYIAHVSLDVIEEKLRGAGISSSKDDMYLGFLGPIEDYRVYGYVTNTSVKFVVVLQDAPVRESELRPFFTEVHRLYVNAMSNPFAPIGERLTSQTFDKRVSNLAVQHNTGA
ncbi:Trafficking protein particle complex subunit 2-like protein [Phytophthora boehmeriae]|uniref:Trafficking protein particle complex subunit 2-like protein n=1 Tax=Phytophthora boehmeriae TaxID=109152 RepID=A0A8T1XEE2_9STRA|nr:Trafficking protein particle complex subunit 2-like protein [Phytophthora boehmeriae]